jgi:hypothetical protein
MTTGRINQVTILNRGAPPGRTSQGGPPRGAERYRVGERTRRTRPGGTARADAGRHPPAIHLPPLSSPRGGPRPKRWGLSTATPGSMRPSGGGSRSPSQRPEADTDESTPPKGLAEQWLLTNHPQTPLKVPADPGASGTSVPPGRPTTEPDRAYPLQSDLLGGLQCPRWTR